MSLNSEISQLYKILVQTTWSDNHNFFNYLEAKGKPEFIRLYELTRDSKGVSKDSCIKLLTMNRKYRIIPFHQFGWYWDI